MSIANKLLQAASGGAGGPVYVDDVFSTFVYEGTGSSLAIDNGVDLDGEGGLIWTKRRDSTARTHILVDSVRGATKIINSEGNYAEYTMSDMPSSFNSNGYTIGTSDAGVNNSGDSYVSWTFRKQEKFFDIVTYTGDGTSSRSISHNLGVTPGFVIIKRTDATSNWVCWVRNSNGTQAITAFNLNSTDASGVVFHDYWMTGMSSTAINLASVADTGSGNSHNVNNGTYVAYLFAHNDGDGEYGEDGDEDIIKCGTQTGDGSSSGLAVDLGFEPQWLFVKLISHSGYYSPLVDSMRGFVVGGNDATIWPNVSDAEYSGANYLDPTSSGFIATDVNNTNLSGKTYMYMAIRRPNKPASEFAATDLFAVANATTNAPLFVSGFPVDGGFYHITTNTKAMYVGSRLQGTKYLLSYTPATEVTNNDHKWDFMNGWYNNSFASTDYVSYMFRRAKGFFDIVAYDGTGSDRTQAHNLGVAPELILIKRRGPSNADWVWYVGSLGAGKYMYGDAGAELSSTTIWSNTAPTASVFSLGNQSGSTYRVNGSGSTYVAYLFASVDGISKIGTYTGNDADQTIDCGFSNGAKFILIKRTDSSGNWYVLDSVRGLSTGSDPWFELNSAAVDQTGNMINVRSEGFGVSSGAGSNGNSTININGASYIFLAIAQDYQL